MFSFYSVTKASSYIVRGEDNDDRSFISASIAVATVAMPVVALFIVLCCGFLLDCRDPLDETQTPRLTNAACGAQLLRSSC